MASETPTEWPWPDALDAVRAAPHHHELLLLNDRVRVLRTRTGGGSGAWPSTVWSEPLPPHTLENFGPIPIDLVSVEVKPPPSPRPPTGPPPKPGKGRARR